VAFATILGGTCTLIGTSTNIAVSAYLVNRAQLEPLGLFEMTPLGLGLVVIGSCSWPESVVTCCPGTRRRISRTTSGCVGT
jgi:hypothetical protein